MHLIRLLETLCINGRKIYCGDKYFRSTSSNIRSFYIDLNYYAIKGINSCRNKKVMGAKKCYLLAPAANPFKNSLKEQKQMEIKITKK